MLNVQTLDAVPCFYFGSTMYLTSSTALTVNALWDVFSKSTYRSVRVGFLSQDTSGSHYNNVTQFSVDGTLTDRDRLKLYVPSMSYTDIITGDRKGTIVVPRAGDFYGYKYNYRGHPQFMYGCFIPRTVTYYGETFNAIYHVWTLEDTTYWPNGAARTVDLRSTLYTIEDSKGAFLFYADFRSQVPVYEPRRYHDELLNMPDTVGIVEPPSWLQQAFHDELNREFRNLRLTRYRQPFTTVTAVPDVHDVQVPEMAVDSLIGSVIARNPDWNVLARDAYQDLGTYQGNGIALLRDIIGCTAAARSTLKTIRSLATKPKAVSDLFLSFHYGWKLMFLDLKELQHSLAAVKKVRRCQAAQSYAYEKGMAYARYQVYFEEYSELNSLLDLAVAKFDLELSGRTMWDFLPFSFVVDWFIKIEEVLTSLDNWFRLTRRHKIVAAGRSLKCICPIKPGQVGLPSALSGNITARYYCRRYGDPIAPAILPSVTNQFMPFHFVEGTALVISAR